MGVLIGGEDAGAVRDLASGCLGWPFGFIASGLGPDGAIDNALLMLGRTPDPRSTFFGESEADLTVEDLFPRVLVSIEV